MFAAPARSWLAHLAAGLAGPRLAALRCHALGHGDGGDATRLCTHDGAGAARTRLDGGLQDVLGHLRHVRGCGTGRGCALGAAQVLGGASVQFPGRERHSPRTNPSTQPHPRHPAAQPPNHSVAPLPPPAQRLACVVLPLPVSPLTTATSCACSAATRASRISVTGSLQGGSGCWW